MPDSSARGDHAELMFGAKVTELGWLWQRVTRDVGIDGRVEVVTPDKTVRGNEFTVQIKSSFRINRAEAVTLPGIKLSSINYWHKKVPPTLLVAIDLEARRFAWEWSHVAITRKRLHELLEKGQRETTLRLRDFRPIDDDGAWEEIRSFCELWSDMLRATLASGAVRGGWIFLYLRVCDVADILTDWLAWIACADSDNVAARFFSKEAILEDPQIPEAFRELSLDPGEDEDWQRSINTPVWAIGMLADIHGGFLDGGVECGALDAEGQLEAMAQDFRDFLTYARSLMIIDSSPVEGGDDVQNWGNAPAIGNGVGFVLLSLRDWARILRSVLFEVPEKWDHVVYRRPEGNAASLRALAETEIRPGPSWLRQG